MKFKSHKSLLTLIMLLLRIILTIYMYILKIITQLKLYCVHLRLQNSSGLKHIDPHCRQLHYNPLDYRHLYRTKVCTRITV